MMGKSEIDNIKTWKWNYSFLYEWSFIKKIIEDSHNDASVIFKCKVLKGNMKIGYK